ncbi:hypothetical protein C8Q80DRAFT_1172803 [Daedaleopsis nitida]|nr:hypothetical protein C8Q80DRAFT_1172803 [Daedaleopsis nitida]
MSATQSPNASDAPNIPDNMNPGEDLPTVHAQCTDLVHMRADRHTPGDNCSALLYLVSPPLPASREGQSWKAKKVTWTIEGRDQGWGGEHPGTFRSAYSWYEACIFRPVPTPDGSARPYGAERTFLETHNLFRETADVKGKLEEIGWTLVPNGDSDQFVWQVQSNRVAQADFARYVVEWGPTGTGNVAPADQDEHGSGAGTGFLDALQPGDRVGLWMRAMYVGWANHLRKATVELVCAAH